MRLAPTVVIVRAITVWFVEAFRCVGTVGEVCRWTRVSGAWRVVVVVAACGLAACNDRPSTEPPEASTAELYSLAQPNVPDGATGEPNTFIWGYKAGEIGSPPVLAIAAVAAASNLEAAPPSVTGQRRQ